MIVLLYKQTDSPTLYMYKQYNGTSATMRDSHHKSETNGGFIVFMSIVSPSVTS